MSVNPLVGTWRLISYELKAVDGSVTYPWGPDVTGFITYTDTGRVSVVFAKECRPAISSADRWGGDIAEKAAAYDTATAYAGTYSFDGSTVVHHVEVSTYPNRVGTDLVRSVRLTDHRVTLETPPGPFLGAMQTGRLVWERV